MLGLSRAAVAALFVGAVGASGCASAPVTFAPGPPLAPVCPLEGCDGAKVRALAAGATTNVCPAAGEAPCAGAPAAECAQRALAAWGEARDPRALGCVATTLGEACHLGDARACGYAGRLWLDGRGVARDPKKGLQLLARACDGGVSLDCQVAVRWLADAEHAKVIDDGVDLRARLDAEHDCLEGTPDACFDVGQQFFQGRDAFPRDRVRSAEAYGRGCTLGQRVACNNLGDAYEYGEGVPRDLARAASLYERACGLGEALGCGNLGHLYETGEGVARDLARARELYREACGAGSVYGCLHVDMLRVLDWPTPAEVARAVERWERACQGRDGHACAFVGLVYEDGPDGVHRDERKSQQAMSRGCELHDRLACEWLKSHAP